MAEVHTGSSQPLAFTSGPLVKQRKSSITGRICMQKAARAGGEVTFLLLGGEGGKREKEANAGLPKKFMNVITATEVN